MVAAIARLWIPVSVVLVAICVVAVRPIVLGLLDRGWSARAASVSAGALAIGLTVAVIVIGVLAIVPVVPQILETLATGVADVRDFLTASGLPPEFAALFEAIVVSLQGMDRDQRDERRVGRRDRGRPCSSCPGS